MSFLTAIIYSVTSSLAGITPDKLPYISERVNRVLPSAAQLKEMLATLENQNLTPEQKAAAEAKAKADVTFSFLLFLYHERLNVLDFIY